LRACLPERLGRHDKANCLRELVTPKSNHQTSKDYFTSIALRSTKERSNPTELQPNIEQPKKTKKTKK